MKYGAASSIVILDYDEDFNKFRVTARIEVPKSEYTYDNAVKKIIDLNNIYNPSWIYVDAGSGEYQIEALHLYGDQHKETGLHNKVKRFQFKQKIDVPDPVKRTTSSEPMKPFMVNQLAKAFERNMIILSPFDEVLHKQLIDYEIDHISQSGEPVFTSKNEHYIDALGLAYLAFVLEFPTLAKGIKEFEFSSKMAFSNKGFQASLAQKELLDLSIGNVKNPWAGKIDNDPRELKGDKPQWVKIPLGAKKSSGGIAWGSRSNKTIGGVSRRSW